MNTGMNTQPQQPRRNIRSFVMLWTGLTLVVGALTFVGIYLASGEITTASGAQNVVTESNAEGDAMQDGESGGAVAQQATPTNVPMIPAPGDAGAGGGEAPGGDAPAGDGDMAGGDDMQMPATPVPTINPATVQGTLPGIDDFILGAHIKAVTLENPEVWTYLDIAKMDWVKQQIRYEPGLDPNEFGWKLQAANGNGYGLLFGVVGDPAMLYEPGYMDEYAAFLGELARIGINGIEVWNEANLDREWPAGRIGGAEYAELLEKSYNAIKAQNSNTLVISAATAPTGAAGNISSCSQNPNFCNDDVWYRELAQAGGAQFMDCVGAHYNEGVLPPTATSGDPRDTDYPTRYLEPNTDRAWQPFADAGTPLPVCYTELGYITPEGFPPLPAGFAWGANTTVAQQATWLADAALMNAQSGKVMMMIIWNLDFQTYGSEPTDDPQAGYAIVRPDGSCPACDSLGTLRPDDYKQ